MVNVIACQICARNGLVPIVQEAGWALEPVWRSAENLTASRVQSPDRPAHSESVS